jgi:hypothetical protein
MHGNPLNSATGMTKCTKITSQYVIYVQYKSCCTVV